MTTRTSTDQHRPESQDIYLNSGSSNKITISSEGYQQILAIIRATAVCEVCHLGYSAENPRVAGLLCLHCFLKKQPSGFTFLGRLDPDLLGKQEREYYRPKEEEPTYLFLDEQGHALLTDAGPGNSVEGRKSIPVTLAYWHFSRPSQGERNGKVMQLSDYHWSIHGDVRNDDVVMLQYGSEYYNNELLFVVMRSGQVIQINKRRPMDRLLLQQAREEIEETKTIDKSDGWPTTKYLINGQYASYYTSSDVYRLVAKRVGEEWAAEQAQDQEAQRAEAESNLQE